MHRPLSSSWACDGRSHSLLAAHRRSAAALQIFCLLPIWVPSHLTSVLHKNLTVN